MPIGYYLRENFYIAAGGTFARKALKDVMQQVSSGHLLYSVDYRWKT